MLRHRSRFSSRKRRGRFFVPVFILFLIAGGVTWYFFFENEPPQATLEITSPYLGKNSAIEITAIDNKSGLKSVEVLAVQQKNVHVLYQKENPRTRYRCPVGPREESAKIAIDSKKLGFSEGPIELKVIVTDFSFFRWFQGNKTVITKKVILDTEAPKIQILYTEPSLIPGGSGITVYRMNDKEAVTGMQLNGFFYKAYPAIDTESGIYIAYYGVPYNIVSAPDLSIIATDNANNTTTVLINNNLKKGTKKQDTINVSDGFLQRKIPEFIQHYPSMTGNMVEQYLYLNNTIRKNNAEEIARICASSSAKKLWTGSFRRMPGSKRAGFADYRSYLYKGKVIDHQVHLGIDIASTKHARVKAANDGIVIYADYLGIYGNMIVIDHGQGVFSLYSHLSQITVTPQTEVKKGDILGFTGTTGMAGGDHLHFSMLIHGIFVNPVQWWDKKWINQHIDQPIADLRLSTIKSQ